MFTFERTFDIEYDTSCAYDYVKFYLTPGQNEKGKQWRSKSAEKITHIQGRLLEQAVILFNGVPFQSCNFSFREEFAHGSEFLPLRVEPYDIPH